MSFEQKVICLYSVLIYQEGVSMPEFVQASIKEHVAIVPGNEFMVDSINHVNLFV